MSWLKTASTDERLHFTLHAQSNRFTMAQLRARYGVSRRIGYKRLSRFAEEGELGLVNCSRAPHSRPHKIRPVLAELLCDFRRSHPDWGAYELLKVLRGRHLEIESRPAVSTTTDLLARRGLVRKRRRRATFRFQKRLLYLANSLVDRHIGLYETDDGIWSIHFDAGSRQADHSPDLPCRGERHGA